MWVAESGNDFDVTVRDETFQDRTERTVVDGQVRLEDTERARMVTFQASVRTTPTCCFVQQRKRW